MSDLKKVVDLYRLCNCPQYNGEGFSASVIYDEDIRKLIKSILNTNFKAGRFTEIEIDGIDIYDVNELPDSASQINFTFNVAQNSANRFYQSKSDFITTNTLKKGKLPEQFFIVDDNYYSNDNAKPNYILKIEKICHLINNLSKLAHFHDIKNDARGNFYRLVFVLNSESKSSTVVIETNLTEEMLNSDDIDISLITTLVELDDANDAHYVEKINTFRNTVIEYVNATDDSFLNLVNNWNLLNQLYSNNLAVYMSGFSFHKAKKEVSEAEIDFAEKISKVISEIINKSLSIPVSLIAAIAIFKVSNRFEIAVVILGVFLTSLITTLMIISQKKQLNRIIHAKDILFSSFAHRLVDEQSEIKIKLDEAMKALRNNEIFCKRTLITMLCLAWVPTLVGTLIIIAKFKVIDLLIKTLNLL